MIEPPLNTLPILYSLQNCPYAMRARLALLLSEQPIIIRAIKLQNKPQCMLDASPKGEVPVLVLSKGTQPQLIIDESMDIMLWALAQNDPRDLLHKNDATQREVIELIRRADDEFKHPLEQYRAAKRYHRDSEVQWRQQCEVFIQALEIRISQQGFFVGNKASLADFALIPFMRQFGRVDRKWFAQTPYPNLKSWLAAQLQSQLYATMMTKHPLWYTGADACFL